MGKTKLDVVVLGSGGHAKVIIDILLEMGTVNVVGCTSADPAGTEVCGVPILGNDDLLPSLYRSGVRNAVAAVGENGIRYKITKTIIGLGFAPVNAISPRAILSSRVTLGEGIAVMPGTVINVDSVIGNGAIVNTGATVDHDCQIGNFAHIGPGSNLSGQVRVGPGSFLGVGCRVLPWISIGEWTVVGAGAVVIRDLPGHVTAVGVPAVIKNTRHGDISHDEC